MARQGLTSVWELLRIHAQGSYMMVSVLTTSTVKGRRNMIRYRYSAWDGSESFFPSPDDVLDSLAEHLLQGGDVQRPAYAHAAGHDGSPGPCHAWFAGRAQQTARHERAAAPSVRSE